MLCFQVQRTVCNTELAETQPRENQCPVRALLSNSCIQTTRARARYFCCSVSVDGFTNLNPSNTLLLPLPRVVGTETVLQRNARQRALQFRYFKPLHGFSLQVKNSHCEQYEHEQKEVRIIWRYLQRDVSRHVSERRLPCDTK